MRVGRKLQVPADGRITGVDGVIIDGIQVTGGNNGLYIRGRNMLIQNSTFIEQTSGGVTAIPGTQSDNIQIHNNEFRNAKRGCDYRNPSQCSGYLSDGSPVAEMDYGIRVHDTNYVEIKGNRFGTMFNHAISIKYAVASSLIEGNTFTGCGRVCIDFGEIAGEHRRLYHRQYIWSGKNVWCDREVHEKVGDHRQYFYQVSRDGHPGLFRYPWRVIIQSPNTIY